jgi:nucleoside-diphosphate-sugar epimerase
MRNPLASDLNYILNNTESFWDELRGKRILITGGTGFFGCWLLETFIWANEKFNLGATACVVSRDPDKFHRKAPLLASHPAIQFHGGDVMSFVFPEGNFSHVVHAATEASARLIEENPLLMFNTILQGTQRTLDFARFCGAHTFLFISSGAVYGKQPATLSHVPEDYAGGPDPCNFRSAYGEGKRAGEILSILYARKYGIDIKIARCFAFAGPYLPLDIHYAIGNFIRDGLQGNSIVVKGDGTPYRSYLYAADLMVWLWTILFRGETCRPYNVGSPEAVSIAELARCVAHCFAPPLSVEITQTPVPGNPAERYVPDTGRAERELNLRCMIPLQESIDRTIAWHRERISLKENQ